MMWRVSEETAGKVCEEQVFISDFELADSNIHDLSSCTRVRSVRQAAMRLALCHRLW